MIFHVTQRRFAPSRGSPLRCSAAFSLVEVVIAMMITVIAVTTFYASVGQAVRVMKAGKEDVLASQIVQERIEALRSAPLWASVTTPGGFSSVIAGATQSAASLQGATETFTITSYPSGGTPIVVTRSSAGTVTTSGSSLSAQFCVMLTARVNWRGVGNIARSRQVSTIITKGGL
jgi:Tfp pilus assembly protein PilV